LIHVPAFTFNDAAFRKNLVQFAALKEMLAILHKLQNEALI